MEWGRAGSEGTIFRANQWFCRVFPALIWFICNSPNGLGRNSSPHTAPGGPIRGRGGSHGPFRRVCRQMAPGHYRDLGTDHARRLLGEYLACGIRHGPRGFGGTIGGAEGFHVRIVRPVRSFHTHPVSRRPDGAPRPGLSYDLMGPLEMRISSAQSSIRFPDIHDSSVERCMPVLLAGGRGSRLHELTDRQCKPPVAFGSGDRGSSAPGPRLIG